MNIEINGFPIPIASLSLLDSLGVLVFVPIMDKLVYPLLAKFEIRPSQLQRIGFGMILATASMACAGGLELYRVNQCCMYQHRPRDDNENGTEVANITIFYQVPQYTLISLSEVFTSITGMYAFLHTSCVRLLVASCSSLEAVNNLKTDSTINLLQGCSNKTDTVMI